MSIQLIGIDEETFQVASEEDRICWAKENTTAGFGLCEGALGWLRKNRDSVWFFHNHDQFEAMHRDYRVLKDRFIYRLAPDYQPPVKRWWFHPCSIDMLREMEIDYSAEQPDHSPGWIEVSEDFARYIQNKPDCECELRIPNGEDDYISYGASDVPPYRWCKPCKPEPPRYEAKTYHGIKYVWDNKGGYTLCQGEQMQDMHRIAKAMNALEKSKEVK